MGHEPDLCLNSFCIVENIANQEQILSILIHTDSLHFCRNRTLLLKTIRHSLQWTLIWNLEGSFYCQIVTVGKWHSVS
jgi:hypothetical protein